MWNESRQRREFSKNAFKNRIKKRNFGSSQKPDPHAASDKDGPDKRKLESGN